MRVLFFPHRHVLSLFGRGEMEDERTVWLSAGARFPYLKHTDVVADALFLVLRNAFGNPGDVADFLLCQCQRYVLKRYWCKIHILMIEYLDDVARRERKDRQWLTCSLNLTHAYTTACVNCRVNVIFEISISFW